MQYYVPPVGHRADEAACCCKSCTCCGKPSCSKRNWASFVVGLAVILQLLGGFFGLGVGEDWLKASKNVFVGTYQGFPSNYTQMESFSLSGSVTQVLSCYQTVDASRPWRESGSTCRWSLNSTAARTRQVLPTQLMGVDWDSAQRRIRPNAGAGVAFGLFAAVLFMMSGPHWPRCAGGPGSTCERATHSHAEIAGFKKQTKYLLAGLTCSLISWAAYYGCLRPFHEYVADPISDYFSRNAITRQTSFFSPITGSVGPYDLPQSNPAYGYFLYEGPAFGLIIAGGVLGTVAFSLMVLVAMCCRGAGPCQGPGSLGPDHPTAGAAREDMAAPGDMGHPAYPTVPQGLDMAPYGGYAVPVAQAIPTQPGMTGQVPQGMAVPYGMNYGAMQGMPPGYYPPTAGIPMQGGWYPAGGPGQGGYMPPGPGQAMGGPMPLVPSAPGPGQVAPQGMMYPPPPMHTQVAMPDYAQAAAGRPAKSLD